MGMFNENLLHGMVVIFGLGISIFLIADTIVEQYQLIQKKRAIDAKAADESANMGDIAYKKKQWQEAIDFYSEAIRLSPGMAEYYCHRAAAYLELGRFLLAKEDCSECICLNDVNARPYLLRGTAQEMLGHYKEASDDFTHALYIKIYPQQKKLLWSEHCEKNKNEKWLGSYKEANKQFRQALLHDVCQHERDPSSRMCARASILRGRTEEVHGCYKEAIKHFKEAITLISYQQGSSPTEWQSSVNYISVTTGVGKFTVRF